MMGKRYGDARSERKKKRRKDPLFFAGIALLVLGVGFFAVAGGIKLYSIIAQNAAVNGYLEGVSLPAGGQYTNVDYSAMAMSPDSGVNPWDLSGDIPDDTLMGNIELNIPPADCVLELSPLELKLGCYRAETNDDLYRFMRFGAGIMPGSAQFGYIGNISMPAHRTGPSDFFRNIDRLKQGDIIYCHTREASYQYEVEFSQVIEKNDWTYIKQTDYPALTIFSCQESGGVSNAKRLLVRSKLVSTAPMTYTQPVQQ